MASNALGRPSSYSQETANLICAYVAQGLSRRKACELVKVPLATVNDWINDNRENFSVQYARAEESRADHYFEHIVTRAQNIKDKDDAQVARVEIDAIKWACSKLLPKKYGDKVDLNVEVTAKRVVSDL